MSTSPFANRVRFILVGPAHPGNIGASARAIKTMGFRDLRVVAPWVPTYRDDPEAIAFATSSVDVLQASQCHDSLIEALQGVRFAWAMSGYDREFGPAIEPVRQVSEKALSLMQQQQDGDIAFVFGCERSGLSNEDFMLCQGGAAIAADPESPSLNLSQAVQIMAYEMHMTMMATGSAKNGFYDWQHRFADEPLAQAEAVEGFLEHFEAAAVSCGALDPAKPRRFMPRVRRLFSRTQLTAPEVDLLRGFCAAVIRPKHERAGLKKPKKMLNGE